MLDQIARNHIKQRFGDQTDGSTHKIGPDGNIAQGKTEINHIGCNEDDPSH